MWRSLLLSILVCIGCQLAAAAPEGMALRGQATVRILGFPLYDARLYTPDGSALDWRRDFGLELTYRRALREHDLVESTVSAMRRQGNVPPARSALAECYTAVGKGDRFLAVTEGPDRIGFWFNGRRVCTLVQNGIKIGFMSIFLGENSHSPEVTRRLLGE